MYSNKKEKPELALFLNLYSKLEIISISVSRSFSYSILYFLLTTLTTDYYLKRNINNFSLLRLFLSEL